MGPWVESDGNVGGELEKRETNDNRVPEKAVPGHSGLFLDRPLRIFFDASSKFGLGDWFAFDQQTQDVDPSFSLCFP